MEKKTKDKINLVWTRVVQVLAGATLVLFLAWLIKLLINAIF